MWLSALFLVKEENAHGDLNEGETVKVSVWHAACLCVMGHVTQHIPPRVHACPRFNLVQATVKVDYGPRKQVTLQFFYPSQAASRKMDSPLGVGTEV